jgi:predicted alpha/beta hydrolase family esterase
MKSPTVIICPGNGCTNIRESNWYGTLHARLTDQSIPCVCENFPDPYRARRYKWIPHIRALVEQHSNNDDTSNVVLVGHSSGAQAALRYAEMYPARGIVLVSATYSDLGDAGERASGYYPQEGSGDGEITNRYKFDDMRRNCKKWIQLHSDDDPFIPLYEAERIRDGLIVDGDAGDYSFEYKMLPGRSHFFEFDSDILEAVLSLC